MKKVNNKGFTLIELLAVIVILAILIMVAMPAVTSLMERAKVGAFVTEGESFAKATQTAYTSSLIAGKNNVGKTITGLTVSGSSYTYFCMTIPELISGGFIEKANASDYTGIVEAYIPTSTNTSTPKYIVSMTNKEYVINGVSLTNLGGNKYLTTGAGGVYGGNTVTNSACSTTANDAQTRATNYNTNNGNFN